MRLIVATDIHGRTEPLIAQLAQLGPIEIVSPWDDYAPQTENEQAKVEEFVARDGFTDYARRIAESAQGEPVFLLGFSVGATSAWHYLASPACHPDSVAVLYYGSRIRKALELRARCDCHLIFAEYETAFSPIELRPHLETEHTRFVLASGQHHGFMNPLHPQFDADFATQQLTWLVELREAYFKQRSPTSVAV